MIFAVDSSFGSFWELSRVSDESEQFGITFLLILHDDQKKFQLKHYEPQTWNTSHH